jgi:OmpA-OmpF porin, OOP family
MARKKYSFLLGLIILTCTTSVSGQDTNVWSDSSYYQSSKLPQYNEFMNNLYAFPPKPRNMWEVGLKVGTPTIIGDVPANFPTFGWGVHVRKALGYTVSLRLEYMNGTATGLGWQAASNYAKNSAWFDNGYVPNLVTPSGDRLGAQDKVYYNYQTKMSDLSLQAIFNLSNIRFHVAKTKIGLYAIAGIGILGYETSVNALNGSAKYNFNNINSGTYDNRKDVRSALKDLLDDSYETPAESSSETQMKFFGKTAAFQGTLGAGISVRLSRRLNLALEDRISFVKDDLLDGQRWSEQPHGDASMTRNFDSFNFLSLGLNINIF